MELSPEKELPPQRRVNRKQNAKCRGIGVWCLVSLTAVAALRPFISRRGGLWAFFHVHQQRTTFVAAGVLYTHEIYQDPTVADLGRDRRLYFFLSNQKGWNDSNNSFQVCWRVGGKHLRTIRFDWKNGVMKQGSNGTTSVSGYFLAVANSCLLLFGHQRRRRTQSISGEAPHALFIAPSNLPQFTSKILWRSWNIYNGEVNGL